MTPIAIVMAVYHPNLEYLRQQLASLAAQTEQGFRLYLVIADGTSATPCARLLLTEGLTADLLCPPAPMNAVQAFEYGITHACEHDHSYIALCDQDDIWRPDRLARGITTLARSDADMVHSDARVIDAAGNVIAPSLFDYEGRLRCPDTQDLLYRNAVTGMTILMTRDFAQSTLPFPRQDGTHYYHDLWLALAAAAQGRLTFIPEPLVDYRQHAANAVGASRQAKGANLKARLAAYALSRYLARAVAARWPKATGTAAFLRSRSWGSGHLRKALTLALRGKWQAMQIALWAFAALWARRAWAAQRAIGAGYRQGLATFDAKIFALSPGIAPTAVAGPAQPDRPKSWWTFRDGRMAAKFETTLDSRTGPGRFVILVPTLNPAEAFAGIATALDLGLGLLARGHLVVFVATDLPIAQRDATRSFLQSRMNAPWPGDQCQIFCGMSEPSLALRKTDRIVATAWWTAHIANTKVQAHDLDHPFHYLIQDYEPCFYPWGTEYASARASYDLPHIPIFNSAPLRDYFRDQRIGRALAAPLCFHPAIAQDSYQTAPEAPGSKRRLAVYGRPDVPRNLFPLCVAALGAWLEKAGLTRDDIEIVSLGQRHGDIELPGGITLRSLGKLPWAEYPKYLTGVDIGLSLMCSPHPSHPPLEMAVAGIPVVTNVFGPKNMRQISPNIITSDLSVPGIVQALGAAWLAPRRAPAPVDLTPLGARFDDVIDHLSTGSIRQTLVA